MRVNGKGNDPGGGMSKFEIHLLSSPLSLQAESRLILRDLCAESFILAFYPALPLELRHDRATLLTPPLAQTERDATGYLVF